MSEPLCDAEEVELPFEYEDEDAGSYLPITEGTE